MLAQAGRLGGHGNHLVGDSEEMNRELAMYFIVLC